MKFVAQHVEQGLLRLTKKLDRVADCYSEILKSIGPGSPQVGMEPVFIYVVGNMAHTDALYERLGDTPLMINMDPEMAAIFKASTAVSSKCFPNNYVMILFIYSCQGSISQLAPEWC